MKRRIAIVTTKQPGTNPRMRKNADALSLAGYDVLVLYAHNTPWADETDEALFAKTTWKHQRIGGHPQWEKVAYLRHRTTRKWAAWTRQLDLYFCPSINIYMQALHDFGPNLVIGHNPGALPILNHWQTATGDTVLFDAEDYHSGESPSGTTEQLQMIKFENRHLIQLQNMTAASPLIAAEYEKRFSHLRITVVNNAFESQLQPEFQSLTDLPLKLVWFSQVIGLDRGLEEAFRHFESIPDVPLEITLIGACSKDTKDALERCLTSELHHLRWLPPCSEQELMKWIAEHHIGLAVEGNPNPNRALCRTNKLFTYPLCGCWTLASHTPAQEQFYEEFPALGEVLDLNEKMLWATQLKKLADSLDALSRQRKAAWNAARDHLNWETESRKLLGLVSELMNE